MKDLSTYDERRYLLFIISLLESYIHEYGLEEPIGTVLEDLSRALVELNTEIREQWDMNL